MWMPFRARNTLPGLEEGRRSSPGVPEARAIVNLKPHGDSCIACFRTPRLSDIRLGMARHSARANRESHPMKRRRISRFAERRRKFFVYPAFFDSVFARTAGSTSTRIWKEKAEFLHMNIKITLLESSGQLRKRRG